ncbi:MAG: 1-acyl-sn-glycerol-3-phosphate acyltransferase [Nitrospinota bacterium]|nr:1-acyl-sn-glycerol-3-phosphate acyltransferase [Nitrospinota bacterium]MDH5756522.1 1-acyl-sn-glycerol-3-phosphate acyltransferase [Nitrospinota bacterium]
MTDIQNGGFMDSHVTLSAWQFALLLLLATWAAVGSLLIPGVRWFLRRKVNRMIDELNSRLELKIPPFKLTKRQALVDRLTYDPEVMEAADDFAEKNHITTAEAMAKAGFYAQEIVPSFNAYAYFRIAYLMARWTAGMLFRVQLGAGRDDKLDHVDPHASVVFVMNHRSNIDYILVAYLVATKSAVSYAVGEWARIWPLQALIQTLGAYFIRRGGGDPLYRKVLSRYVRMAIEGGVTQAVYPEGRLSRDGALQKPRMGLLGYMLTGYSQSCPRDILFVPVGINYDRVLEDRSLARYLDPKAGKKSLAASLFTTASFIAKNLWLMATRRWYSFGYAGVNFGRPVSVKQRMMERGIDYSTMDKETFFIEVEKLADELMEEIGRVIPVTPVALVARAFEQAGETRLDRLELLSRTQKMIEHLEEAGVGVFIPKGDREYAMTVGLRTLLLRRLALEEDGLMRANPSEVTLLRYYANSIAHLFPGQNEGKVSS